MQQSFGLFEILIIGAVVVAIVVGIIALTTRK